MPDIGALAAHEDGQVALQAHADTLERPGGGGELHGGFVLTPGMEPALVWAVIPARTDSGQPGRAAASPHVSHAVPPFACSNDRNAAYGRTHGLSASHAAKPASAAISVDRSRWMRSSTESLNARVPGVVEPRPGLGLPPPGGDLDGMAVGTAHVLEAKEEGMQGEGAQGTVGRAVGSRVVHRQELDHLEAGAGCPDAERREVGVLADAAAQAAPQGREGNGDARQRMIDRAELHELTVTHQRIRRNNGSRGRGRKVKMAMNAARCRIPPSFHSRLLDSVADAVARSIRGNGCIAAVGQIALEVVGILGWLKKAICRAEVRRGPIDTLPIPHYIES